MSKSRNLSLWLSMLILFSTVAEAGSKTSSVTKCVDAAGNVTFTTMGCKSSEKNASTTATPTVTAEVSSPTTTSTPQDTSSTQTNSTTSSSSDAQQPIEQPVAEPATDTSSQEAVPLQNKREKLGEGSPDSVGVGGMGL
jgi:hypothetical protein